MAATARMEEAIRAFSLGRLDEAARLCRAILQRDPGDFYALHLSGVLAIRRGEPERAVEFATQALRVRPGHPEVLGNRGAALRLLGRHDAALIDYDAALALAPRAPDLRNNRGVALAALGRHEEAIEEYRHALDAAPRFADALYNLGISLGALNRHAEAVAAYTSALDANPEHAQARWNRGLSRLALGDFAGGFADYEVRDQLDDPRAARRRIATAGWNGRDPVAGRTVLLLSEQGFGDVLQFSRFARPLHARGARVVLEAPPALAPLLEPLPYLAGVVTTSDPLPPFDLHCALTSLPGLLGTRLETLPAQDPPLQAPREWLERWSRRLAQVPRPRIGIAWSGGTGRANDPRSIPLAAWSALRELPAGCVALQKEIVAADRPLLEGARPIAHFEDEVADFRDTAALAQLVDAVVTIDTAVAHLAGAMAQPTTILLPFSADWRWLVDRDDSPWYPTARLIRQPRAGDWASVLERAACDLRARLDGWR